MKFVEKLFLRDLRLTGKILLYFFIGLAILVFLIHGFITISFKYPLDYGEGPLLNQALRITKGEALYPPDLSTPPYLITNYPPLYVVLNAFFVWIFGPSLFFGRLISFLCTIGTALIIGLIIKTFYPQQGVLPRLIGVSFFLIIPYVLGWSTLFRIDMLALLLSVTGLYIVVNKSDNNLSIILAASLFVLSAYTRQSFGLAGPLAAIIWLGIKNRKQALKLILIYSIVGLAVFGAIQLLSNGGFYFHIIKANVNPFNWQTVINYGRDIARKMPWILFSLLVYLTLGWRYCRSYFVLAPYIIGSVLAALTIGKIGSNVNYLVELSAALAILMGVVSGKLWEFFQIDEEKKPDLNIPKNKIPEIEIIDSETRIKMWGNLIIFLALTTLLISQLANLTVDSLLEPISGHRDRMKMGVAFTLLKESINAAAISGPILADEYMAILPDNNIPLYIQPFELSQLANAGLWDQSTFLADINQHTFPLILIHHFQFYPVYLERWTQEMQDAIYKNYVAKNFRADTLVFEPKNDEMDVFPENRSCPNSPWQIPSESDMGLFWYNRQLILMGAGYTGEVPVHAIADGMLYQFPQWKTAVAIMHNNPFDPGRKIWSFYGDMAPAYNADSAYIDSRFLGAEGVPVKAGDLIGYQGQWLGPSQSTWVHLRFALIPADSDGGFPEVFLPIENYYSDLPSLQDQINLGFDVPISISSYLGLPESNIFGTLVFLPFQCAIGED